VAAAGAEALMATRPCDRIAGEQAALRRVATLVARAAPPEEVFTAVTEETGRLLHADFTGMGRYNPDGTHTLVAAWSSTGPALPAQVGTRARLGGQNIGTLVFQSRRPVRIHDYAGVSGPVADVARRYGIRAAAGVPISVEGRLWGVMVVGSTREGPLPAGTEAHLAGFTELAATAIANAQARMELRGFAEEQAALRRVATLVAGEVPPEEVFAAVAGEAGRLLHADFTCMSRYDPDGAIRVVAAWSSTGSALPAQVGIRACLGGQNIATLVFQARRPVRIDDYPGASGPVAEAFREFSIRAAVGVPVSVEGRLWGVMVVGSTREGPLPAGTEAHLAGFTELAATAIANAQARMELRGFAGEQAALRRVATLVARAAAPEEVFAAVAEEVGWLLRADFTGMSRYDPDGAIRVVAAWSSTSAAFPVGSRWSLGGRNLHTLVFQTRRPARIDDLTGATGAAAKARELGVRASVGVPISVEGRLWGLMIVESRQGPLPAGTEAHLAGFTELAATAIANAEAQTALTASRARIVAAADTTRRRIERDLHDGVQQRLFSLGLRLRAAQAAPPGAGELVQWLDGVTAGLDGALEELREIARGIHPAVLARGGLCPALTALAGRSAVPVRLDVQVEVRLPDHIEIAAYYVVTEALTNAAKHAHATAADVEVASAGGVLHVCVRDDGRGGAGFGHGSGLAGLRDRAEALGGRLWLHSPPGEGTTLRVQLPVGQARLPAADGAGPGAAHSAYAAPPWSRSH
jgi:GAF domain-containing protein